MAAAYDLTACYKFSRAMVAPWRKHGALRERNGVVWRVGANLERGSVAAPVAERAGCQRRSHRRARPGPPPPNPERHRKRAEEKPRDHRRPGGRSSGNAPTPSPEARVTAAERRLSTLRPGSPNFDGGCRFCSLICDGEPSFAGTERVAVACCLADGSHRVASAGQGPGSTTMGNGHETRAPRFLPSGPLLFGKASPARKATASR